MFVQETTEPKSDSDRLRKSASEHASPPTTSGGVSNLATKASNHYPNQQNHSNDEMQNKTSYSVNKQQTAATALHQHYLNYFNSNIPKEEAKSQRTRNSIFAAQEHPSQMSHSNANQRTNHNTTRSSNASNNNSTYVYHNPSQIHNHHPSGRQASQHNMSRSVTREEASLTQRLQQQQYGHQQQQQAPHYPQHPHMKHRTHSTGALCPIPQLSQQQMAFKALAHINTNEQHQQPLQQQDRDSEEITTTIKEELENDIQGCRTSELEAISSLERNLPIELSFLIRQQAHCMARMNYLDRQIRELKEAAQQQVDSNQVSSSSILNQGQIHRPASNVNNVGIAMAQSKNGNFILSDDSGGEYSRATISDDDELSSLLDQIAKSVRPERASGNSMIGNNYSHLQLHQQQQRHASNCGTLLSNQQQPQQPYAIINPNQIHHQQAVPIFVMGSPIAVAHPSSINSNILPGVHFQPEPRYNQYYEDFYYGNNISAGLASSMVATPTSTVQKHGFGNHQTGHRSQQFDSSISAIEQLVIQKEKRQIISQLKSADNWLKMRSSNQDASLRAINKHQSHPVTKQSSNEATAHDVEPRSSDSKEAIVETASTSNLQTS